MFMAIHANIANSQPHVYTFIHSNYARRSEIFDETTQLNIFELAAVRDLCARTSAEQVVHIPKGS